MNSFQNSFNIKPPLCPGFLGGLPPSGLPTRTLHAFFFSRPRLLEHQNNIGQYTYEDPHYAFFPSHLHFLTLRTKYLPRHPIIENPQTVFFLEWLLCLKSSVWWGLKSSLTFTNSTFCPHSVFMYFVLIAEQTVIINWLVCITKIYSVYCAVRTGYLNTVTLILVCNRKTTWRSPTQ